MSILFAALTLDQIHSTYLILALLGALVVVGVALMAVGFVGWLTQRLTRLVRAASRAGFRLWERTISWARWPILLVLAFAILAGSLWCVDHGAAWVAVPLTILLIAVGTVTCFAYMHISVERFEVSRGFKTLYNPEKGQELAVDLLRYGPRFGVPMLGSAAAVTVFGFALLNQALYESGGQAWYGFGDAEAHPGYADFLAYTFVNLLRVVDVFDLAKSYEFLSVSLIRPEAKPAAYLLLGFKTFFSFVLLQQVIASLRRGWLLAETVTDFWSPHVPVRERARSVLPQFGPDAVVPILVALRSATSLNKEQREQLPLVLAGIGPTAVPALLRNLRSRHETTRLVSAAALGLLKVREAIPHLAALARDPAEGVRLNAMEALGLIGEAHAGRKGDVPQKPRQKGWKRMLQWIRNTRFKSRRLPVGDEIQIALDLLREALKDSSAAVRERAAVATGRIGVQASDLSPTILQLLRTDTDDVRVQAATALGFIRSDGAAPPTELTEALGDPNAVVRGAAAQALGEYRELATDAVSALVGLLQDGDESVRTITAAAIAKIGVSNKESTSSLVEGLSSSDNVVRARTAESLGQIGAAAESSAPALVEALDDPNDRVRAKAAEALGRIGEAAAETAVPALMRMLRDEDNWVRALAAEALGEMGESAEDACPALLRSLRHANPLVRGNAAESLGKLRSELARPDLESACSDAEPSVRAKAVRAVSELPSLADSSKKALLAATVDPAPEVRGTAVQGLSKWASEWPESLDRVLALIGDGNSDVVEQALLALQKYTSYPETALETVLVRLRDSNDARIQSVAALTLGRMGASAETAGPDLAQSALTGDIEVRQAAMRALALLQPPEAGEAFATGLRDAEAEVRKIAAAGLLKEGFVPDSGVAAVIDGLRDPDLRVRTTLTSVVGRMDPVPTGAIPILIENSGLSNDEGLRLASAIALRSAGTAVPERAMSELLKDPNRKVRLVAVSAILASDPASEDAIAAIREALADPNLRIRELALSLIEPLGEKIDAFRQVLDASRVVETEAAIRERIDRLLSNCEPVE